MIDAIELERRFDYHDSKTKGSTHALARGIITRAAQEIVELIPPGREQSLAITKLEEALMWANAAIARPEMKRESE